MSPRCLSTGLVPSGGARGGLSPHAATSAGTWGGPAQVMHMGPGDKAQLQPFVRA